MRRGDDRLSRAQRITLGYFQAHRGRVPPPGAWHAYLESIGESDYINHRQAATEEALVEKGLLVRSGEHGDGWPYAP